MSGAIVSGAWDAWRARSQQPNLRVLVIQRDNIGDLVLTTPFLRGLRTAFPDARIDALVNSYNAPVLKDNSAINHLFVYTKLKHRTSSQSALRVVWNTLGLRRQLRSNHYDLAIVMGAVLSDNALRSARASRSRWIAAFTTPADAAVRGIDLALDPTHQPRHAVELHRVLLGQLLPERPSATLPANLPACEISVDTERRDAMLKEWDFRDSRPVIAFHISARKVDQRWDAEHFAALMRQVYETFGAQLLLLWAPGSSDNALHPGDDEKADEIIALTSDLNIKAHPTENLQELICALSLTRLVVLSDGGAMHIAAALQRPLVAMFGNSDPAVWHAWATPQIVVRDASNTVAALSVDTVFDAVRTLFQNTSPSPGRNANA